MDRLSKERARCPLTCESRHISLQNRDFFSAVGGPRKTKGGVGRKGQAETVIGSRLTACPLPPPAPPHLGRSSGRRHCLNPSQCESEPWPRAACGVWCQGTDSPASTQLQLQRCAPTAETLDQIPHYTLPFTCSLQPCVPSFHVRSRILFFPFIIEPTVQ